MYFLCFQEQTRETLGNEVHREMPRCTPWSLCSCRVHVCSVVTDDTEAVASCSHRRWQIYKKKIKNKKIVTGREEPLTNDVGHFDREKPWPVRTNRRGHKLWQRCNVPLTELHSPLFNFFFYVWRLHWRLPQVKRQSLSQSQAALEKSCQLIWQHSAAAFFPHVCAGPSIANVYTIWKKFPAPSRQAGWQSEREEPDNDVFRSERGTSSSQLCVELITSDHQEGFQRTAEGGRDGPEESGGNCDVFLAQRAKSHIVHCSYCAGGMGGGGSSKGKIYIYILKTAAVFSSRNPSYLISCQKERRQNALDLRCNLSWWFPSSLIPSSNTCPESRTRNVTSSICKPNITWAPANLNPSMWR